MIHLNRFENLADVFKMLNIERGKFINQIKIMSLPINKGFPSLMRSSLDIRLTAPALVRGGKNSREKNLSLDSILARTFSASVAS